MSSKSSKARVTTRLKQKLGSQSTNKSSDLISATNNYEVMKKRLKLLIAAVKNHHEAIIQLNKTRNETVKLIGVLSLNTPLFEHGGALKSEGQSGNALSYASVHTNLATQSATFVERYGKYVVDYVVEWERVISTRLSAGLQKEEKLRLELDHYQAKVEGIRQSANVTLAKGKMVDPKTAEKLSRNEEKLLKSRTEYEKFKNALCVLIDEATLRSWKDLHPLLTKMIQFDVTVAATESKMFSQLNTVISSLKTFAEQNHITGESRLNQLENLDAYALSGTSERDTLTIENGNPSMNGNYGENYGDPLGGPMGGSMGNGAQSNWNPGTQMDGSGHSFNYSNPVGTAQQSNWNYSGNAQSQMQTQNIYGSNDGLSTLTNAAPAPTFDSLNEATQGMSLSQNGYSDPFAASPVPGVPTAPPPQMPPPVPPTQTNLGFASSQMNQSQQYNQLTISSNPSLGYNYGNTPGINSPASIGANSMNSQANAFNSNRDTYAKNPFDSF